MYSVNLFVICHPSCFLFVFALNQRQAGRIRVRQELHKMVLWFLGLQEFTIANKKY